MNKPINDYEGLYSVDSNGVIYSHPKKIGFGFTKERTIKIQHDKDGYAVVYLRKNKTIKQCKVHRLVADAFLENVNGYTFVIHKDGNRDNNNVNNLEWRKTTYADKHK